MFSYIITFMYGFLSGFVCNYIYKLYKSYKFFNDIRKIIVHEAYSYLSEQIFTIVVDDLVNNISSANINGIQNLNDFKKLIDSSINITKEFNKSFNLNIVNDCELSTDNSNHTNLSFLNSFGKIQLKLNNSNYINDPHFAFICKFFTDNNIDLHIVINDTNKLENKLEYIDNKKDI